MYSDQENVSEMNGKNVPIERRAEVRLSKSQIDESHIRAVTYKIATSRKDLEESFSLVWENYVQTGLQRDDSSGLRLTKYHLLPNTRVFVARFRQGLQESPPRYDDDGICVGTVTLVLDSSMGLPMEEFCGDEIDKLRKQGRKVAEVVAFAVDPKYSKYKVFLHMFKLLFQFAAMKGVTDLCCSVTERHIKFYRKVCLFEPIGKLVPYSAAYKLKVQGHRLDIKKSKEKAREFYEGKEFDADLHRFFFGETYNRDKGEGKPLDSDTIDYFINKKTDFINHLVESDLNLLRTEYKVIGSHFPY